MDVVTESGSLSCTSQMFDFIRDFSICRVLSDAAAELEENWKKNEKTLLNVNRFNKANLFLPFKARP